MKKDVNNDTTTINIDWDAPKLPLDIDMLAQALDAELYEKEWFVTGQVNPVCFSSDFRFQDPDVKVTGIQQYAEGVQKIFDASTCRAEVIATTVTGENQITCTWRLSGTVRILGGLTIKPYCIVRTEFTVKDGLIVFQQDKFDLPGWDILLSAVFPALIGKVTAPPAPPVEARDPSPRLPPSVFRQKGMSPMEALQGLLGKLNPNETS